jgi:RNA polymerase sigma-70 factor (sigma-E family)
MGRRTRDDLFRAFATAEGDGLQRFATFMCGDPDRAADLVQEALLRTYRNWARIRGAEPGPYARKIIVNQIRDEHRSAKVRRLRQPAVVGAEQSAAPRVDDWLEVTEALRTLSPVRRATIVLRFYEDLSESQIADLLDRPVGTVKSDIHRSLAALRPLLEREEARGRT